MAMSNTKLAKEIYDAIGIDSKLDADQKKEILANWEKIASAIISHIKTNMELESKTVTYTAGSLIAGTFSVTAVTPPLNIMGTVKDFTIK